MSSSLGKKGQIEHILSDALPGILFIVLALFLITVLAPSLEVHKTIDLTSTELSLKKTLLTFLEQDVVVIGEHQQYFPSELRLKTFEFLSLAPDRGWIVGNELSSDVTWMFATMGIDFASVFDPVYGRGNWLLVVLYGTPENPSLKLEYGHERFSSRKDKRGASCLAWIKGDLSVTRPGFLTQANVTYVSGSSAPVTTLLEVCTPTERDVRA